MRLFPALAVLLAPWVSPLGAETTGAPLRVELNALEAQDGACRLIFVAENPGADLDALVLEAVLFDTAGRVAALTLLDFRDLPAGRMRVRSFDMAGLDCAALDRLLINDIATCEPTGGCANGIEAATRTDIELLQ
jgi:hypothetical protein